MAWVSWHHLCPAIVVAHQNSQLAMPNLFVCEPERRQENHTRGTTAKRQEERDKKSTKSKSKKEQQKEKAKRRKRIILQRRYNHYSWEMSARRKKKQTRRRRRRTTTTTTKTSMKKKKKKKKKTQRPDPYLYQWNQQPDPRSFKKHIKRNNGFPQKNKKRETKTTPRMPNSKKKKKKNTQLWISQLPRFYVSNRAHLPPLYFCCRLAVASGAYTQQIRLRLSLAIRSRCVGVGLDMPNKT